MISAYQGEFKNVSSMYGAVNYSVSSKTSTIFISNAWKFDSAMSFANPYPLIILAGMISKSYSKIIAIHFPLLPSGS